MKKALCAILLAALFISVALFPGAAADKKGVRLCFIVDSGSVAGCTDGASLFDAVLNAVLGAGEKAAFFFDDENINYDADFATALMKAFSSGMSVGVFDTRKADVVDRLGEALMYQKYITRTRTRLILTTSAAQRGFTSEYAVYTADIILTNPDLVNVRSLSNFEDTTMVIRISTEFITPVVSFYKDIKTSGIYMITPTEAGLSGSGTEG